MRHVTALVALLLLAITLGCGKKGSIALKGDSKKVIGHLKWAITDAAGNPVGAGERDVVIGEVRTSEAEFTEMAEKLGKYQIPLSDKFHLGIGTSTSDKEGIGLFGGKDDEETFSWDWFNVSGNTATKLQESGQLGMWFTGNRASRIDFQTDVSLRLMPMSEDMDITNPKWRILISKGSYLSFPRE